MSQRVDFKAVNGITLRGDYYPVDGKDAAIVVMTQGVNNPIPTVKIRSIEMS